MKSSYPKKIDTSKELEIIKNNLTELRAEIFNSYRSAIIQIEKTLGVNPQGIDGATVASRLNTSVDEYGNIKESALDYLNLLKGPVKNSNVSNDASIEESKLNLDFSTNFLYNQVSSLKRLIDEIDNFLDEIRSKLSSHINLDALNRHKAKSIIVDSQDLLSGSSDALVSLEDQNLQVFLEKIIFGHIKFSPENISSVNNSHIASQIHFDNSLVQESISSSSVQSAIEELGNLESASIRRALINIAANCRLRSGQVSDAKNSELGLLSFSGRASINSVSENNYVELSINEPSEQAYSIVSGDLISVSGFENSDKNKIYVVRSATVNASSQLTGVSYYGFSDEISNSIDIKVYKNFYSDYNSAGLNIAVRSLSSYTDAPYLVFCNPNSSKIVSSNIRPQQVSASSKNLKIKIDDSSSYEIDIFNQELFDELGYVTLDSIVEKINQYSSEYKLPFAATKVLTSYRSELCIFHLISNFAEDSKVRSIEVEESASDDALVSLGLYEKLGLKSIGLYGNSILQNGVILDSLFENSYISGAEIVSNTQSITRQEGSFLLDGIKEGNLLFIENTINADDSGCFIVRSVSDLSIEVDHTFLSSNNSDTTILVLKNTVSLRSFEFEELSPSPLTSNSSGSIYFDCFYDKESMSVFAEKNFEVTGLVDTTSSRISILRTSKNLIKSGEQITIHIDSSARIYMEEHSTSLEGDRVLISSPGVYTVYSKGKDKFVELNILFSTSSLPASAPSLKAIELYGSKNSNHNSMYLGSFLFSNTLGRVFGGVGVGAGIPSFVNEANSGPIDETKISDSFVEKSIGLPLFESIGNYISFGLSPEKNSVASSELDLSIQGGIAYIGGRRIPVPPIKNLKILFDSSKNYFLTLDSYGSIELKEEIPSTDSNYPNYSPSFDKNMLCLAHFDGSTEVFTKLRASLDSINDKILKTLYVSPSSILDGSSIYINSNSKQAHFNNIQDAINYSMYYKKITGGSFYPKIVLLDGYHYIENTIQISHSVSISGLSSKCFLIPIIPSVTSPETLSLSNQDLSSSSSYIPRSSSIINVIETSAHHDIDEISISNLTIRYDAADDGLLCGILIDNFYNLAEDIKIKRFFENINFECIGNSYTDATNYKYMVPICFQSLDNPGTSKVGSVIFSNVVMKNLNFKGLKTDGYAVSFNLKGNSNKLQNIIAKDCLIISSDAFSDGTNQVFSIRDTLVGTANIVDTSNTLNGVAEYNILTIP